MSIRVIGWSTGTVGIHAVPAIVAHPDLELAGLWVHSDNKAGRDAGELCGIDATGVESTQDADALLAACGIDPQARPETLPPEAFAKLATAWRGGLV